MPSGRGVSRDTAELRRRYGRGVGGTARATYPPPSPPPLSPSRLPTTPNASTTRSASSERRVYMLTALRAGVDGGAEAAAAVRAAAQALRRGADPGVRRHAGGVRHSLPRTAQAAAAVHCPARRHGAGGSSRDELARKASPTTTHSRARTGRFLHLRCPGAPLLLARPDVRTAPPLSVCARGRRTL